MNYQKFLNEPMPKYSRGEEIFNYVSHIVGGGIGILIWIITLIMGFMGKIFFREFFAVNLFSISCIFVYVISSLYHALKPHRISKRIMRIIDHCDIYFLIAGTYTPVCLIALWGTKWCLIILIIEWVMAIGGIIMNAIDLNNKIVKIFSMIFYIVGGWIIIFFPQAINVMDFTVFILILAGGISYTIGSILYGIGAKKKWFHSIFHLFCLLGTILQAIAILLMIL